MNRENSLPQSVSLRMKLVLSYLGVTLGSILVLIIVVAIAVPDYFYNSQVSELRAETQNIAGQLAQAYQQNGNSWNNLRLEWHSPKYIFFTDGHSAVINYGPFAQSSSTIDQALAQALKGQEAQGTISEQVSNDNSDYTFTGLYVSEPVTLNNQVIGAIMIIQPNRFSGFSTSDFLANGWRAA